MLTAVDHVVLGVTDLPTAVRTFENLGFDITPGIQPGLGPISAFAVFDDFYLELRGPADIAHLDSTNEGLREIALRSDDLDSDVTRLTSAGLVVSDVIVDAIDGPGGSLRRNSVVVDLFTPVRLVEHQHDPEARQAYLGSPTAHPNTAKTLERAYLAVESIERDLPLFEDVFGVTAPEPELGTVIMSLMSVFYLGDIGVAIAEPRGPGPTADALDSRGPGLFQVLFRAEHLDEAAKLMIENGLPGPERGTRLSGESALLVRPAVACGAFVAMAGPA